jgi:hypothetical protein
MGTIAHFNLSKIRSRYGCLHFVETGTGSGASIEHARGFSFKTLFSIEMIPQLAAAAQRRFSDDSRVRILNGATTTVLPEVLNATPVHEPVLFWLDAHFPGADFGENLAYDAEKNVDLRLPLERELEIIKRLRPLARDVILIDDLRIYIDGPFSNGPLPPLAQTLPPEARHIDFVERLFGDSHKCSKLYDHEGYIVLQPRTSWLPARSLVPPLETLKGIIPWQIKAFVRRNLIGTLA